MDNTKNDLAGMIDRYVYDVTRRLPKNQREDIDAELRGLIEDMLEERSPQPAKADLEAVLIELGRPSALAAKYRGSKRFLIGPELFDVYFLVLKIVSIATAFGITVALIVGLIASPPSSFWTTFGSYFASIVSGVVQAFAYVTLVFAIIERFASKKEETMKDNWKPLDLPEIPKSKARIKISEPIAGLIFLVIALLIVNLAPEFFGIYSFDQSVSVTPIFNLEVFRCMLILIDIMIGLDILKEMMRLMSGKYTLQLAIGVTAINVVSIILVIMVFLPPAIWNQNFVSELLKTTDTTWAEMAKFEYWWLIIPKIFVGITIFGKSVEIITNFVRRGKKRKGIK